MKNARQSPSRTPKPGAVPMGLGRMSAPAGKSACYVLERRVVANEGHAEGTGDGGGGEVVGRRPESARRDDGPRFRRQPAEGLDDPLDVVVDRDMLGDLEAQRGQFGAQPRRVRIDQLSAGQFRPDRKHGARHWDHAA
jgi:hypothetical protein